MSFAIKQGSDCFLNPYRALQLCVCVCVCVCVCDLSFKEIYLKDNAITATDLEINLSGDIRNSL